ncbi:MAG: hypothetical protein FWC62_04705, partial [Firmicutes bacterium]|nr:hypothetical protein [Bacillota bacterium]
MNNQSKTAVLQMIGGINAVEGFDPAALAVDYTDLNTNETRKRLPVMAQIAWFRLKYPEGRISVSVQPGKDCFIANARVYMNCHDPVDSFLAEASASRGPLPDKPTVSPREWAQTAAVGKALRNAGFGLQFDAAGESFDDPAVDELNNPAAQKEPVPQTETEGDPAAADPPAEPESAPEPLTYESAQQLPCPISKHKGKTLGDLILADPGALVYLATKYAGDP